MCPVEQIWFGDSETRRFNAVEIVEVGGIVWGNSDAWRKRDDYCVDVVVIEDEDGNVAVGVIVV